MAFFCLHECQEVKPLVRGGYCQQRGSRSIRQQRVGKRAVVLRLPARRASPMWHDTGLCRQGSGRQGSPKGCCIAQALSGGRSWPSHTAWTRKELRRPPVTWLIGAIPKRPHMSASVYCSDGPKAAHSYTLFVPGEFRFRRSAATNATTSSLPSPEARPYIAAPGWRRSCRLPSWRGRSSGRKRI
jgi:hypothetical protein